MNALRSVYLLATPPLALAIVLFVAPWMKRGQGVGDLGVRVVTGSTAVKNLLPLDKAGAAFAGSTPLPQERSAIRYQIIDPSIEATKRAGIVRGTFDRFVSQAGLPLDVGATSCGQYSCRIALTSREKILTNGEPFYAVGSIPYDLSRQHLRITGVETAISDHLETYIFIIGGE